MQGFGVRWDWIASSEIARRLQQVVNVLLLQKLSVYQTELTPFMEKSR